jgi:hypothetical protein
VPAVAARQREQDDHGAREDRYPVSNSQSE